MCLFVLRISLKMIDVFLRLLEATIVLKRTRIIAAELQRGKRAKWRVFDFCCRLLEPRAERSFERQNYWVRENSSRKDRLWKSQEQPSRIQDLKIIPEYHTGKGNKKIQMILPPGAWHEDHWPGGIESGMGHGLREGAGTGAPQRGTTGKGKEAATKDRSPPVQWSPVETRTTLRSSLSIPGGTAQHLAWWDPFSNGFQHTCYWVVHQKWGFAEPPHLSCPK